MILSLNDKAKIEKVLKKVAGLGKKAAVAALNDAGFKTREHVQMMMDVVFDRPTPFIKKSVWVNRPDIKDDTPKVSVGIANETIGKTTNPTNVMNPEVFGGYRKYTRFEKALRAKNILPPQMYAIPGKDAKLNQYGNIQPFVLVQILSALQAFNEPQGQLPGTGWVMNETLRSRLKKRNPLDLFVMKDGNKSNYPPGIYQRRSNKILHIIQFVSKPYYKKAFNFYKIANKYFDENYEKQLNYQLAKLDASAGPSSK